MRTLFRDRVEAGRFLAGRLMHYAGRTDVIVLGLPRGGVPVAFEVARALAVPLDVFVVRKLGVPGREELAMGAIASGGVQVLDQDVIQALHISSSQLEATVEEQRRELERREQAYRGQRPAPVIRDRTVILVDDGLATGSTMRAAARAVSRQRPAHLVAAVPVGSPDSCAEIRAEADEVVCAVAPKVLGAVGIWYQDFTQTSDDEVRKLLAEAAREFEGRTLTADPMSFEHSADSTPPPERSRN